MSYHGVVVEDLNKIADTELLQSFDGKRVMVTGGSGFVGRWLNMALWAAGAHVGITVRNEERLKQFSRQASRCYVAGEDNDYGILMDFDPHYIIHAASPADPVSYTKDPVGCWYCNATMTQTILEYAAMHKRASVLFISSGEVYGPSPFDLIKEYGCFGPIDPMGLRSCYANAKRAGEGLCFAYAASRGVQATVARLHHSYGPMMPLNDSRVVHSFLSKHLDGQKATITGSGIQSRTFLYATDMVMGLLAVLRGGVPGTAYNVGSETVTTIKQLANVFQLEVEYVKGPMGTFNITPDCTQLQLLGWREQVSLKDGVNRTIRSYK